jgi:hypothetical protein
MFNQNESLKHKESFRKAFFEVSGLNLTDEITEILLSHESITSEQLSKHNALREIGIALINLDKYTKPCDGTCPCIDFPLLGKRCITTPQTPPDED